MGRPLFIFGLLVSGFIPGQPVNFRGVVPVILSRLCSFCFFPDSRLAAFEESEKPEYGAGVHKYKIIGELDQL